MILAKLQEELIETIGQVRANDYVMSKDELATIQPVLEKYSEYTNSYVTA